MSVEGPYSVRALRNVRIPMADGITLAADLHLPCEVGDTARFPAIIEYTPYHKNNNAVYGPRASRYPYFASHGYTFVNVDIRGTGDSEGCSTAPTSPEEVRDGLEVIRWCTEQDWCDGNVGMIGISYTAGVCYDAARRAPEALKAIVVCQMCSDWYDGMACPGGTPRPFAYENYAPLMAAYNFAPPDPDLLGERWAEVWRQRLDGSAPWSLAYLRNLQDGPFWQERLLRGEEGQVRAATFLIGGWCDWYPDDLLEVYSRLRCPKRVLIGPWTHNYPENAWPLPRLNDRYECLRWFDQHLKGIDTDPTRPLAQEPPVVLYRREFTRPDVLRREDPGDFVGAADWPPAGVEERPAVLEAGGKLTLTGPEGPAPCRVWSADLAYRADVGVAAGRYAIGQMLPGWGMPDDQRLDEPFSLVFSTSELSEPLDLMGAPLVDLRLSCTASVAFLSVKLCDVAADGTSVLVTKGVLNLTHRESHADPRALCPGEVLSVRLPLLAVAYRFLPGHRLRVMIAAADFQNAWPSPLPHTLTLHSTPDSPPRVTLPVGKSPLPAPEFRPSDFPPLPVAELPTPEYRLIRDLIRKTAEVRYSTKSGVGVNQSRYEVSLDRPAEAVVESEFEYPLERSGLSVRVRSNCLTRSDSSAFHHLARVEITVNGRSYWDRSWALSVPRTYF
jgi:putative CocE/NonD family hydrolase